IHITPNGDYVYASERNSSSLSAFRVDPETGKLTYIDSFETDTQPRGFSIDPSGQFLISAGQVSNTISVYKIEQNTGRLTSRKTYPVGENPNWVEIINLN
ncbi:beta-propeller fold lactonase family protein, partial [Catenovulum maritimum]